MRSLALLFLLVCSFALANAAPQSANVITNLRAHRFDEMERQLESIDKGFQAGRISEFDLLDAYKAFYQREDILSEDLRAWEHERPNSYIAHLASGTYRRKLGDFRRGEGYIQSVPPDAQRYMAVQFAEAKQELWRALELNPRSFLSMLNLMNIAQDEGDDALADKVLALSVKAYPGNLLVRARYVAHLTPRWGGSAAAMDAFIGSSPLKGPSAVTTLLEAVQCDDRGFTDWEAGRIDRALSDYRRCMALARDADPRFVAVYLVHSAAHCEATADRRNFICH